MDQKKIDAVALNIETAEVAKAVFDNVLRIRKEEAERLARVESKATAVMSAAGVSAALSVAGAVSLHGMAAYCAVSACVAGGAAAVLAVWAARVRGSKTQPRPSNAFNEQLLSSSNHRAVQTYHGLAAAEAWEISEAIAAQADEKAKVVLWAQYALMVFVALALGSIVVRVATPPMQPGANHLAVAP